MYSDFLNKIEKTLALLFRMWYYIKAFETVVTLDEVQITV